jgi:hypothetical protein
MSSPFLRIPRAASAAFPFRAIAFFLAAGAAAVLVLASV